MRAWEVYLGAALLAAGTLLPVVEHSVWLENLEAPFFEDAAPVWRMERQYGNLFDLGQAAPVHPFTGWYWYPGTDVDGIIDSYHAVVGTRCLIGRGWLELLILFAAAVGTVLAHHVGAARSLWIPMLVLGLFLVADLILFARSLPFQLPVGSWHVGAIGPRQGPAVCPFGWVAAGLGVCVVGLGSWRGWWRSRRAEAAQREAFA